MFQVNIPCPECEEYTLYEWVGETWIRGRRQTNAINCVICGTMLLTNGTLVITLAEQGQPVLLN